MPCHTLCIFLERFFLKKVFILCKKKTASKRKLYSHVLFQAVPWQKKISNQIEDLSVKRLKKVANLQ